MCHAGELPEALGTEPLEESASGEESQRMPAEQQEQLAGTEETESWQGTSSGGGVMVPAEQQEDQADGGDGVQAQQDAGGTASSIAWVAEAGEEPGAGGTGNAEDGSAEPAEPAKVAHSGAPVASIIVAVLFVGTAAVVSIALVRRRQALAYAKLRERSTQCFEI